MPDATRQAPSSVADAADEEYPYLVSWAFRRPASIIRSPAIIQHVGYWIAFQGAPEPERLFDSLLDQLRISHQFEVTTPFDPSDEIRDVERPDRSCRLKIESWHTLPVTTTLELHREYLTVSSVVELSEIESLGQSASVVSDLRDAIKAIRHEMSHRYGEFSSFRSNAKPEGMSDVRERLIGPYQEVFLKVWDNFHKEILQETLASSTAVLGRKFVDFRGFVTSSANQDSPSFFDSATPPPPRSGPPRKFDDDESVRRAHTILPFMTAETSAASRIIEKQLTVSRFLNRCCIYASMVGAQRQGAQPITYFMLTSGISSWELGRLVDNIHTLGTVRLASRRFLSSIKLAGDDLHRLEKQLLEEIDARLPGMIIHDHAITKVISQLSKASIDLLSIRKRTLGGLLYRVERSRYYRSQFKSLVTALRIGERGRIDGFQPYDEFVERRFGSTYEFIDMVGKRFERVEQQLSALYQRVRTAEAALCFAKTPAGFGINDIVAVVSTSVLV